MATARRRWLACSLGLGLVISLLVAGPGPRPSSAQAGCNSLTTLGSSYTENFNTLASSGSSNSVPGGWAFAESGTNANTTYTAGTGSGNAGDTYSFGAMADTERAFGCLQSGSLIPMLGACFTNNTSSAITSLTVSYTGEQWRLGTAGRADRLNFQISLDATSLTSGTWTDADGLDFSSPTTAGAIGALNGNAAANRVAISSTITGLSIAPGATFRVRWIDFNASGADDGLAVDDFSLTPSGTHVPTDPTGVGEANPNTVAAGDATLLTVTVTPGANPASTGIAVNADLSSIGGSATQQFFDDGSNGDVTPNDKIFSFQATVSTGTTPGAKTLPAAINDAQARTGSATIPLTVQSGTIAPGAVVISQVYGGGGNSGATFRNDFIELFNRTTSTISVSGWSIQYTSSTGNIWQTTPLTGSIPPGRYYLVQEAAGAGGTTNLPAPDGLGTISMSATAGKVALVSNTTALSGACPSSTSIIDLVGYGTASCFEGGGAAPGLNNTTAGFRRGNGCQDTDNNSADFSNGVPSPRNSASPFNDCNVITPTLTINQIQGGGTSSPYNGQVVSTTFSIVTGLKSNGFFIQSPDAGADSDPNTSEGIFVFTGSPRPAAPVIGDAVTVKGSVTEFVPSQDPNSPPLTQLAGGPVVTVLSSGNVLPVPVTLTAADTSTSGTIEQLEKYEGMRVFVNSLTATAPTQGNKNEANATSTSTGVFYAVITGVARPFREPGIEQPFPLPPGSPCCVPRFDANPERLRVDSDAQPGAATLNVTSGAVITNITGPLDYSFRTYTILPDAATPPAVSGNISAVTVPVPAANEFTVASFNMERFYDTVNDPGVSDVALTPAAYNNRLNKASLAIRNVMLAPDIIGVVEMENLNALQTLAIRINNDAVAASQPNPNYQAYLIEGNDVGGIDVGFLVKGAPRVNVIDVTQEGLNATFINPDDGQPDLLNDRPPLVLQATIQAPVGPPLAVTVIVNHLRSLNGIDDAAGGNRVRAKRRAQAEFLANLIRTRQTANPNERIISLGDYNAFQFSDGYVDLIGTIKGTPTPASEVVLASDDLVNPDLVDLAPSSPDQRYSYSFDGNAQVLDHMLITQNLLARLRGFHYARSNADFPEVYRGDALRPERLSDHDMPVAYFDFPPCPPPTITCPVNIVTSTDSNQCSAVVNFAANASDGCQQSVTVTCTPPPGSTFPVGTTTVNCTATNASNNISACSFTVTVIDDKPPVLTCSVAKNELWPPTFNFVNVGLAATAADNCGGAAVTVEVYSDEADGDHPGGLSPDALYIAPGTLQLRSEREGNKDGRVYLVIVTATDSLGNVTRCCRTVTVPKSVSDLHRNGVETQAAAARAYCQQNGTAPPAYFPVGS